MDSQRRFLELEANFAAYNRHEDSKASRPAPRQYLTPIPRRNPRETTTTTRSPTLTQDESVAKDILKTMGPKILPRIEYIAVRCPDHVLIFVGAGKVIFAVHEDVIKHSSDFFRAAITGRFQEAIRKIIRLPEVEVDVFKSYVHYMYTGQIVVQSDFEAWKDKTGQLRHVDLAKLYVAGDMLGNLRLRNAVIDRVGALTISTQHVPWAESVRFAYANTPDGSTLRKIYKGYYSTLGRRDSIHGETTKWYAEHLHEYPEGFDDEVRKDVYNWSCDANPLAVDPSCIFHEHDDQVPGHVSELSKDRLATAVGRITDRDRRERPTYVPKEEQTIHFLGQDYSYKFLVRKMD